MSLGIRVSLALLALLLAGGGAGAWFYKTRDAREPSRLAYAEHCAQCHGPALEGTELGPALVDAPLQHGSDTDALIAIISSGLPERGMPAWQGVLSDKLVKGLALYVSERRQQFPSIEASFDVAIPDGIVTSQHHDFRVETVATFATRPYSIAPLPNGRVLVTEKIRGLSIIEPDGTQSPLIANTPRVYEEIAYAGGGYVGYGMLFDVALDPAYAHNGWIYLSHTDRCQLDCGSMVPISMVRVVRGRIRDGRWVDEEVIWASDQRWYNVVPDRVAAARLALHPEGDLFLTIGGKAPYDLLHVMDAPTGKIHRVRQDGTVPEDNPFWVPDAERDPTSTRHTVYSYGHRTAQGLEIEPGTGHLWSTEMGPRGGDEINLIESGGNYGWPLYTNGLDYDGEPVTIGTDLGLDFPVEETVLPVVDYTPAPAISSFAFHRGSAFPDWAGDMLVGTLKAQTLYRVRIRDGRRVEEEKLLTGLARIRDVDVADDGTVYLLLEHGREGSLVRMTPSQASAGR